MEYAILGPLVVTDQGRPIDVGGPKQKALLASLLIGANRIVSSSRLVGQLWGNEAPVRAIGALQVYVSNLRRALEPDRAPGTASTVLVTRAPGYLLVVDPPNLDAARFEAATITGRRLLAAGQPAEALCHLSEALALWRGPVLADCRQGSYAVSEATRLEELRLSALEERIAADLALGEHHAVAAELEVVVAAHPLRERFWALLMLALYRCQRQADALRAYGRARHILGDEFGIEPGPELRRLEHDILVHDTRLDWKPRADGLPRSVIGSGRADRPLHLPLDEKAVETALRSAGPLFGRDEQIDRLMTALQHARAYRGQVALVSGEAGIGKTVLVDELAARAERDRILVARGNCHEGGEAPTFWPWTQIVRDVLAKGPRDALIESFGPGGAAMARIVPELTEVVGGTDPPPLTDADNDRFILYDALSTALVKLSAYRPLLIVIDDLHWADLPSLQLLTFLARRIPPARILVAATYRHTDPIPSGDLDDALGAIAGHGVGERLHLAGLDHGDVARFIQAATGAAVDDEITAVVRARTDGNPFYISELLRLVAGQGELTAASSSAVPPGVRAVIRRRVTGLPTKAKTMLVTAAIVGRDFDFGVVETASGLGAEPTLDAIDVALSSGIVVEHPTVAGRYRFSHALVREAIVSELGAIRRAHIHARVGAAIEALHPRTANHVLALAHHFYEAAPSGHAAAAFVYALEAATIETVRVAFESAENHLTVALNLLERIPRDHERDRKELEVLLRISYLRSFTGGYGDSRIAAITARSLELCGTVGEPSLLLPTLIGLAGFHAARAEYGSLEVVAQRCFESGRDSRDPGFDVQGHWAAGTAALLLGQPGRAERHLSEAVARADTLPPAPIGSAQSGHHDPAIGCREFLAIATCVLGDGSRTAQVMEEVRILAGKSDQDAIAVGAAYFEAFLAIVQRDQPIARGRTAAALKMARDRRFRLWSDDLAILDGWAMALSGEPELGISAIRAGLASTNAVGMQMLGPFYLSLLAEAQRAAGHADDAMESVAAAISLVASSGERFYEAELYRLRGELLRHLPGGAAEATSSFVRAVAIAEEQGAVLFERRARAQLASAE